VPQELHLGRERLAVDELDAAPPAVYVAIFHQPLHLHHVRLRHGQTGVHQGHREIAVVGDEQGAARVEVEPPHRVDARRRHVAQEIVNGAPALGVAHGRDHPPGLVEDEIHGGLAHDALPVDLDASGSRVDLRPELGDDAAVDAHAPGSHQLLGGTAGRHPCMRQDLLQSHAGHPLAHSVNPRTMRRVAKPWGYEIIWAETDRYVGKILHITAGQKLSRQYHLKKDETFLVEAGEMDLEIGQGADTRVLRMKARDSYHCTPRTVHRMVAVTDVDVIEVSTPELDDVVRLEDAYGREGTNDP
jgi:mannose-6-phosphate isomerase